MEKSVWCSSALHFACSCHNCHILMTPPTLPPAPLFSLAQSTAVNDSMDTPYRELFWVMYNVLPLGYCLNFRCCHPALANTLKQGHSFDNVFSTTIVKMGEMVCWGFIYHVQTFKVTRFVFKTFNGCSNQRKSCSKKLVTSTPSRFVWDMMWDDALN